jgi:endonuclease YncB( thermonuclease family)
MYDCLGRIIIIKLASHQLHPDFTINKAKKGPVLNLFITSANQLAANAATQVHMIYERQFGRISATCFYPPFSPRWNFSFKGCLINKGATKVFYDKLDEELGLRM